MARDYLAIPANLWAEVRKKTKKRKGQVQISEHFVEEMCSLAVLDFLRSTGVGRTVPTEDGEKRRRIRTGRASRLGRGIRKMYDVLSALISALLSVLLLRLQSGG